VFHTPTAALITDHLWQLPDGAELLYAPGDVRERLARQREPNQATRTYVRTELGVRMVQVTDSRQALQVERLVQRGRLVVGRPNLNPLA
jgi:hypothetical protein